METSVFAGDMFFHVSVCAERSNAHNWGDTQYAEGLLRAIRRIPGCGGALFFRGETPALVTGRDVVLRIVGPQLDDPLPGVPNLLWMISPPNVSPGAALARYQTIFSGSGLFTQYLRQHGIEALYAPQATETSHFHPDRRPADAPEIPVVFVGAYAPRADRRLVLQAVKTGHDVRIWGPGWQGVVPDRCLQGERLNYDELAQTYATARIILNSHMPQMAERGFMSNRSFDALATGAEVVSDPIPGFLAPTLPELTLVCDAATLARKLDDCLARPALTRAERIAMNDRVARDYGFDRRAQSFVAIARDHLAAGRVALGAQATCVRRLGPASGPIRLTDPAASAETQGKGLLSAAEAIMRLARAYPAAQPPLPATAATSEGVIHPLMADLREMQALMTLPATAQRRTRVEALAAAALRLVELLQESAPALGLHVAQAERDAVLARAIRNEPLWQHSPSDFQRDINKVYLALRPRQQPVRMQAPIGVFLHLYYSDLAAVFAERLRRIDAPVALYVSTDTDAKARDIARHMPDAELRIFPNRGRDIWPKLYGFGDVYDRHGIILHLHGKKSQHTEALNDWLQHVLDCLLGPREEINRILSLFQSIPTLGLVTPLAFRTVLSAAHWGANKDIARELAFRIGRNTPLPDNSQLQFPVGSMFWGRTEAIRPLLDLNLRPGHFPPEAGQLDGTVAHAIERMIGVTCQATGHSILPVAGGGKVLHAGFRREYQNNRDLRQALEAGDFRPAAAAPRFGSVSQ
ncbi:rhamnan synthesis F family protein [Paracoccaceae bacterium]